MSSVINTLRLKPFTGLVALKKMGFLVETYFASEICDDSKTLVRSHYSHDVKYIEDDVRKITHEKVCLFLIYAYLYSVVTNIIV